MVKAAGTQLIIEVNDKVIENDLKNITSPPKKQKTVAKAKVKVKK